MRLARAKAARNGLLPTRRGRARPILVSVTAALVLALFRVAINEGALANAREVSLIWQVTTAHGHGAGERLAWLRRHSPQALGLRIQDLRQPGMRGAAGNAAWASHLVLTCEKPEALEVTQAWWNRARKDQCLIVAHLAEALVMGRVHDEPCEGHPTTWGGLMDHARAVRLGMVQHRCVGVLNEGWSWPGA